MDDGDVVRKEEGKYPFASELKRAKTTFLFSVNPSQTLQVRSTLTHHTQRLVDGSYFRPYLPVCYARPHTFGEDRLLLVAFGMRQHRPTLIVDVGTALTVNWIDSHGYRGGAILPGLTMGIAALHKHTSLLPLVDIEWPQNPGCSTEDAIRLGILEGAVGAIRHLGQWLEQRLGNVSARFITGGDASLLGPHLPEFTVEPDLPYLGAWWLYKNYLGDSP